jgi:hypothetical protein
MRNRVKATKMVEVELPLHQLLKDIAEQNDSSIYFLVNMIILDKLEKKGYRIDKSKLNKIFHNID